MKPKQPKPCPFCGKEANYGGRGEYGLWWIYCDGLVRVYGPSCRTQLAAIRAWNRRKP